jgi:hypothetical protein
VGFLVAAAAAAVVPLTLSLALAQDSPIAIESTGGECPTRADVVAAISARFPGAAAETSAPDSRRLTLQRIGATSMFIVRLRDARGTLELERVLKIDLQPSAKPGEECAALAEAAALVVVRYLREIGYRPPPPPPPPPPAPTAPPAPTVVTAAAPPTPSPPWATIGLLGAAGGGRIGLGTGSGVARAEALLGFEVQIARLSFLLGAGASTLEVAPVAGSSSGRLDLRAYPLRLAIGLPVGFLGGVLVPAVGASVDILSFRASGLVDARRGERIEPAAEIGASYRVAWRGLFARALVSGGVTAGARDFDAGGGAPVFRTPDGYLRAGVELGVVLWKN